MKNILKNQFRKMLLLTVCTMSLLVVSCSSDDDGPGGDPVGNAPPIEIDCSIFAEDVLLVNNPDAPVDYIINCSVQVQGKVTIEPGVVIEFGNNVGLRFVGTSSLQAVGTADKPIIMRGTESHPGWWQGLNFLGSNHTNTMEYVDISYSGKQTWNGFGPASVFVLGGLTMKNSTISHSEETGLLIPYGTTTFNLENNTFSQNVQPMVVHVFNADKISETNDFTGNEIDKVIILARAPLQKNDVWQKINVPYLVQGTVSVAKGGSITVDPGVEIEMAAGSKIRVQNGGIKIVGTEALPIIIRGENPGPGTWKQIDIASAHYMNEIGYAKISDAGENPSISKGAVSLYYETVLNIHNTEFKDLASCGVYGLVLVGQTENPNYSSSNLTFINTPCTELFERP